MQYDHFISQQFGLLTVIHQTGVKDKLLCRCACGKEKIVRLSHLRAQSVKSCGCLLKNRPKEVHGTHLASRTAEHKAWYGLVKRCTNPKHRAYANYGGRGISVCERWLGKDGFTNFLSDMGKRAPNQSIDRINNDGHYTPENCRWASKQEQSNNRRTNIFFSHLGKTLTLSEWSKITGISDNTMRERLKAGWSVQDTLTIPLHSKKVSNSF